MSRVHFLGIPLPFGFLHPMHRSSVSISIKTRWEAVLGVFFLPRLPVGVGGYHLVTAHSILVIIYQFLEEESTYQELGPSYFEEREHDAIKRRSIRNLERLGYHVSLQEADDVA